MNILYIVDDINSANGRCVISVASKLPNSIILSTYRCRSKINAKAYYVYETESCGNQKIKILMNLYRWPLKNPALIDALLQRAEELIREYNIDIVVCVYNSIEALIVGEKIKKLHPNIKTIAYLLDALYKGGHLSFLPFSFCEHKALKWQEFLFNYYDAIIMMQAAKKNYENEERFPYYNRLKFLDLPLLSNIGNVEVKGYEFDDEYVNCVFVGSLPQNIRNPEYACALFSALANKKIRFYLFGHNDYKELEKKYCDSNVIFKGQVSYDEALSVMKSGDVLVNIGNSIESMTPSKIFEYMTFEKKIVSFYSIENDSSLYYIEKYRNGLCIDVRKPIEESIKAILAFINGKAINVDSLKERFYLNTPEAFEDYLHEIYLT